MPFISDEHRKKINDALAAKRADPEWRARMSEKRRTQGTLESRMKGVQAMHAAKDAQREAGIPFKGHPHTEAEKQNLKEKQLAAWARADEETRAYRLSHLNKGVPWDSLSEEGKARRIASLPHSRLEDSVAEWLRAEGVELEQHYNIGPYEIDIYVPASNLCVEVDGCYWHGCEVCGYKAPRGTATRDRNKDAYLKRGDHLVLRIPEHRCDELTVRRLAHVILVLGVA
jgi:very-short-patch-repair endonuclease